MRKGLNRFIPVIMALVSCYSGATAVKIGYATDRLGHLAEATGVDKLLDDRFVSDTTVEIKWNDVLLSVRCDGSEVSHIGRKIFANTTRSVMPSPVYDFIERLALENMLGTGEDTMEQVTLEGCGFDRMVRYASDSTLNLNISHYGGKVYEMTWVQEGRTLCRLSFPSSFKLLKGMELPEYQRRLPTLLTLSHERQKEKDSVCDTVGLERRSDGVWVCKGVPGLKELMSNDTYFSCREDSVSPLLDSAFPLESVRNLWNLKSLAAPYRVCLLIQEYKRKTTSLSMPLTQLLAFFESEECTPFTGIMDFNEETGDITALVEMTNKPYSYMHVLKMRMNVSQLEIPGGKIDVDWLSYIPTHHLVRRID